MTEARVRARLVDALRAACHPRDPIATSVVSMTAALAVEASWPGSRATVRASGFAGATNDDVHALVVRLARLFVDDRNAAEDLVQEAFIRLSRSARRIEDERKAAAYLRSIVLNLARDHNRRGLLSLRHQLPLDDRVAGADDEIDLREDQREVLEALRELPLRQRNCVVLRHLEEIGIAEIAAMLSISENSVKTHLKRGMAALARQLGEDAP
jgi:RNA polymerase sigma factor (sigma-70 family)